jgi:uncharacterized protein YutE (UPF0331/DUF86 family)
VTILPVEREAILPRIDGIRKNLKKLAELASLPFDQFCSGDPYDLAQHHLRLALEGVFHISSHILSRIEGGRAVEYKEIARKMGELQVVPKEFAEKSLVPMAGMRNILVHHYSDIDAKRLYEMIRNHQKDIESFLKHIKDLLADPQKFGVTVV